MTTAQQHAEAIRAAFRQYDLTEFLTSEMYTLVKDLHLVDVNKNEIVCMGKCVNGGKCYKRVNVSLVNVRTTSGSSGMD